MKKTFRNKLIDKRDIALVTQKNQKKISHNKIIKL